MATKQEYPRTIKFESGQVRISRRSNGRFSLSWREDGQRKRTTITQERDALSFAGDKARELNSGLGRRWVSPTEAEQLESLKAIAGTAEGAVGRLLADLRGAREWLDGKSDLTTATRWFAEHGPLRIESVMLSEAITRYLAEYANSPAPTRWSINTELKVFLKQRPDMPLIALDQHLLRSWVDRKTLKNKPPVPTTVANRIRIWKTFLNRSKALGFLPENGKTAADRLKIPVCPDAGREIFDVPTARKILETISDTSSSLQCFFLIGGWLGLRPSEIQRLKTKHLDFERLYCHCDLSIAQKTSRERFVPIEPRLAVILARLVKGKDPNALICTSRAREFLTQLLREKKVIARWPSDVLRHSFCSYRLAMTANIHQVADEAGNSPKILRSNYRRPLRREDGEAWWALLEKTDFNSCPDPQPDPAHQPAD